MSKVMDRTTRKLEKGPESDPGHLFLIREKGRKKRYPRSSKASMGTTFVPNH